MTTISQMIDQVSAQMHSYTGTLESTTYLTSAITATDTTVPVQHPSFINRGLVEIGEELLHVQTVGETSAELMPFGRGVMNTQAVPHAANSRVTNDPFFPRQQIFDALKRCIHNVQLDLFMVKTATFLFSPVQTNYEMPSDMVRILSVQYQVVGPSQEWINIRNWDTDQNTDVTTGKSVIIHDWVQPGRTVQVVYAAELPIPETVSTDLESSGIPQWMQPVLLYGTCWEMVQFMEPQRLTLRSVEQRTQSQLDPAGAATNLAKQLYAMYQLRLEAARRRLLTTHPTPKHSVRY